MKHDLDLSPTDKTRTWKLNKEVSFQGITVPAGFIFDGASIPIGLRWRFPMGGKKMFAACVHDWLYRNRIGNRKVADWAFLEAMLDNGVPEGDAKLMYYGVRVFGGLSWVRRKKR